MAHLCIYKINRASLGGALSANARPNVDDPLSDASAGREAVVHITGLSRDAFRRYSQSQQLVFSQGDVLTKPPEGVMLTPQHQYG